MLNTFFIGLCKSLLWFFFVSKFFQFTSKCSGSNVHWMDFEKFIKSFIVIGTQSGRKHKYWWVISEHFLSLQYMEYSQQNENILDNIQRIMQNKFSSLEAIKCSFVYELRFYKTVYCKRATNHRCAKTLSKLPNNSMSF